MWNGIWCLVVYIHLALGLSEDQVFSNDWQTVNFGLPFDSLQVGDRLLMLTSLCALATVNSTNGDVLYRYQPETRPIEPSSGLAALSDNTLVTYFNWAPAEAEHDNTMSKLMVWNFTHPYGTVEKEMSFSSKILAVLPTDDRIYVVDQHRIVALDISQYRLSVLYETSDTITSAKLVYNNLHGVGHVFVSVGDSSYYSSLSTFALQRFDHCHPSDIRHEPAHEDSVICNNREIYQFTESGLQKAATKENLINEKLSADVLVSTPVQAYEVIDDYVLISSENTLSVFNHRATSVEPVASFVLPLEYATSVYHSFFVSENATEIGLLTVSFDETVQYFVNGVLQWSSDQSFVDTIDYVVLNTERRSSLTLKDYIYEIKSNIFVAYVRRLIHNYNTLFGKLQKNEDSNSDIFGMSKKLIALSENNKIGIFDLLKSIDGAPQLPIIYTPPVKISKLYEIRNQVYGLSGSSIFLIDIDTGKIHQMSKNFILENFKQIGNDNLNVEYVQTNKDEFYSKRILKDTNSIQGYYFNNGETTSTWKFTPPSDETLVSVTDRSYDNDNVAQNGLVLPDRSVLYKYLIPNVGIATTFNKLENMLTLNLINLFTGQIYGTFLKEVNSDINPATDFNIKFEENFIIFTIPDPKNPLNTEISVIDLFESLVPNEKVSDGLGTFSSFEQTLLPAFASQTFLLPSITVRGISISKTKNNISTKEIIFVAKNGQIFGIPKMVIDGRRNGIIGDFKTLKIQNISNKNWSSNSMRINSSKFGLQIASRYTYDPIINIDPAFVLSHYRKLLVNNKRAPFLSTIPTDLESTSYVIYINGDIFVNIIRPSGSFDKLTSSFNFKIVISTILILILAILFFRPKSEKLKILDLWNI